MAWALGMGWTSGSHVLGTLLCLGGVAGGGLLVRGALCSVVLAAPRGPARGSEMAFEHLEARRDCRLILLRKPGGRSGVWCSPSGG